MAQQQIITKPYVVELQDNDSLFINHDGALRQIKKSDADFASGVDMRAEVAAREAFEVNVEGQIAEKANVDGYYEEMTVGDAEQLVATQFVEDNEPYLFRSTGGSSDVGNRAYLDKIVGGTVAWNQIFENKLSMDHGVTITNNSDGSMTLNGTSTSTFFNVDSISPKNFTGHKCMIVLNIIDNPDSVEFSYGHLNQPHAYTPKATRGVQRKIYSQDTTLGRSRGFFNFSVGTVFNDVKVRVMEHDLTQMFGSTIADYIYSIEQSQAGAGVAWFKKLFPNDYYAYNAGELLSVGGLSAHVMRDADNNVIGNYPLDSSLTLRGIPKLDASNNLYYDGDEYTSDGKVKRKYGIVDLGTLDWRTVSNTYMESLIEPQGIKSVAGTEVANIICPLYQPIALQPMQAADDKRLAVKPDGKIFVRDSAYTDVATFKAAMSGVMLIYELATPTTETAEPFHNIQVVDDFGTEEFVSTGIVPVGHNTRYPANLRDKLQHLPSLASADGTYLIQQSGKQMSLVHMPAVFPETPTEDGTYTLKTVVTGGVATLQWVVE